MYHAFISYFYEGNITRNDMTFVLSVKNQDALDFTHSLGEVKEVIKKLSRADFKRDAVLNFDLLSTLLQDHANNEYLGLVLDQISNGRKRSLEFIDAFLTEQIHANLLINRLCKRWPSFWKCIALDSGYASEKINRYLKMIILHADIDDVVKMNGKSLLSKYISEKVDFFSFTSDVQELAKLMDIITKLNIQFVYIEHPEVNEALFRFVYENDFYAINERMIELIIQRNNPDVLKGDSIKKSNYTTILESNCAELIEHINANINEYVENVLLALAGNVDEAEDAVIGLLSNENIESEYKGAIIEKERVRISDISTVTDIELWNKIILSSRVKATWNNLLAYFNEKNAIDDAMVNFLNQQENYDALSKSKLKESDSFPKELTTLISSHLLLCAGLTDKSYEQLIKCIPYWYSSFFGIENVSNTKVGIMIREGKFQFTEENFIALKKSFNSLYGLFVEKNIGAYLENISKYKLDSVGLQMLLNSKTISADQKITIVGNVDATIFDNKVELTSSIYQILLGQAACPKLNLPLLEMLLKQNIPMLEKVRLFMTQADNLDVSVISNLLILFGSPISGITSNQHPTVENNEAYKLFSNKLIGKGILSSFKEDGDTLRLYPKKS